MAKVVGYFSNSPDYSEGPFVLCRLPYGERYRLESELRGHVCSVLVHLSVDRLLRRYFPKSWEMTGSLEEMLEVCDWLNERVREGVVVLRGLEWAWEETPALPEETEDDMFITWFFENMGPYYATEDVFEIVMGTSETLKDGISEFNKTHQRWKIKPKQEGSLWDAEIWDMGQEEPAHLLTVRGGHDGRCFDYRKADLDAWWVARQNALD